MEDCVEREVPGAAGAGVEAEEERAGRGRRDSSWCWLLEEAGVGAKRLKRGDGM